jgi:(1->4)-alpha-D-glucan 1-alpha-D-glucosylmutase
MQAYMEKALREAKRNTNWVDGDERWEQAVGKFVGALYEHEEFLADFEPFVERLAELGDRIALGQLVLKLTVPGIPDIYQGDELQFRALVDPDNRRPVDFDWHQAMLRRLMGGSPPDSETRKLFITLRLLGLRGRQPETFLEGGYTPLEAGATTCAFLRGENLLVLVALREQADGQLEGVTGRWRNVLRGEEYDLGARVSVSELLGRRGIAVLERLGGA